MKELVVQGHSAKCSAAVILALGLFLGTSVPAFTQSAKVEGLAVNAATGEPIVAARVSLCEDKGDKVVGLCDSTSSDRDGRFVFAAHRPGRYRLEGQSSGFFDDSIVLDGHGTSTFELAPRETRSVRLRLWPESTIRGRVLDENGHPISGVSLAAVREDSTLGRRFLWRYQHRGGLSESMTGKDGGFGIQQLIPGKYYLEAYPDAVTKTENSLLKRGYVPAYFPDEPTLATATPVCIGAGEQREIEFRLRPRPTYSIRGKLDLPAGFTRSFEPLYGLTRDDGGYFGGWTDKYDQRTRSFVVELLPPGSYSLEMSVGIYDTDPVARLRFNIADSDVDSSVLPMRLPFTLQAKVQLPDGFKPKTAYSTLLNLEPDGTNRMIEAGQTITKEGRVNFARLHPGHYKLYLFTDDPVYIESAHFGQQDVLANGLSADGPSTATLEVTLGRANAEIRGNVLRADKAAAAGADVKLIAQGESAPYVIKSVEADQQGQFVLTGVPPGKYDLVALDDPIRDWEFGPSEFAQVERWAVEVQAENGSRIPIDLEAATFRYTTPPCSVSTPPRPTASATR